MNNTDELTVLSSLPYFDSIRLNQTGIVQSIRRDAAEKLDWLKTTDSNDETPICHVTGIAGLTLFQVPEINGYQELVSAMLAFQHLNDGDGSIAPEVEGLNERCPIRFTFEINDALFSRPIAAQQAIDAFGRPEGSLVERKPCAFYGARASLVSMVLATLTGINDYLQLAAISESPALDDQSQFPLFGRTTPNQIGAIDSLVTYLSSELGVNHLATLNANDEFGNAYADSVRASINRLGLDMSVLQIPYETDDPDSQRKAVELLKDSNYRFVYLASGGYYRHVDNIIEEALDLGVAGVQTHTWFFHRAVHEINGNRPFPKGSAQHLVYRGHGFIAPINVNNPAIDPFVQQMEQLQNPTDLEYMNSFFRPFWEPNRDNAVYMSIAEGIENGQFLSNLISQVQEDTVTSESLNYDAAIAMGLATCDAYAKHGPSFTGRDQFQSLLDLSFTGLSGPVQFLKSGTRDQSTFNYGAFTTFEQEYNETHATIGKRLANRRIDGEWQYVSDFLFNDGSANIPSDLPPVELANNDVSPAVRGVVFAMYGVVLVLVAGFAFWTRANITERVVLASQPFFLYTLLTGITILASTIIPISIDHSVASLDGAVIACNSSIWLLSVGFCVTFSALFTKNYRINRILKAAKRMKRIKVTVADTIVPMVALLLANSLVLTLMTILAPIDYVTTPESFDRFARPDEFFSRCSFEDEQLPYIIALAVLNGGCLLYAIFQAYEARNLSVEFSESLYIFQALMLILLVSLIGIPVMLLARDDANSYTFLACAIIFVVCCSIMIVIFVPKIQYLKKQKKKVHTPRTSESLRLSSISETSQKGFSTPGKGAVRISGLEDSTNMGLEVYGAQTKEELFEEVRKLRRRVRVLEVPGPDEEQAHDPSDKIFDEKATAVRFDMTGQKISGA